jgi:hypothetical protein
VSTSTAPAVRAALIAALAARPGLAGVTTTYFWQGDADTQEAIYLGTTTITNDWVTMRSGRKAREEAYRIQLHLRAFKPTDWGPTAEARAFAIIAEIENLVADDPSIGLSATMPTLRLLITDMTVEPVLLDPGGIGAQATLTIEARNRLS